jgi:hypothetical protein
LAVDEAETITTEQVSEEEATREAELEGATCEEASEGAEPIPESESQDFSALEDDDLAALDEAAEVDPGAEPEGPEAPERRLGPARFTRPGGGWGGSEAPIRRAIRIAHRNGLVVTSLKRNWGSTGSDHHVGQSRSFAADLSNGSSPTPQMNRTCAQIARALGHPAFRAGILNVVRGSVRIQMLYKTNIGGNHFNHVHVGARRL